MKIIGSRELIYEKSCKLSTTFSFHSFGGLSIQPHDLFNLLPYVEDTSLKQAIIMRGWPLREVSFRCAPGGKSDECDKLVNSLSHCEHWG